MARHNRTMYKFIVIASLMFLSAIKDKTVSSFSIVSRSATATTTRRRVALASVFSKHHSSTHHHDTNNDNGEKQEKYQNPVISLPQKAVKIYADYASRLWKETNPDARKRIANDQATAAIRRVQHLLQGEEYTDFSSEVSEEARKNLLEACNVMLTATTEKHEFDENKKKESSSAAKSQGVLAPAIASTTEDWSKNVAIAASAQHAHMATETVILLSATNGVANGSSSHTQANGSLHTQNIIQTQHHHHAGQDERITMGASSKAVATKRSKNKNKDKSINKKKKPRRSILFGAVMGFCVACWVFSGNYIFTGLFTLMTILGQLEYYRMVMNTGVYPARRITVIGASSMFLTALFAPNLHQICLPLFGLFAIMQFLFARTKSPSIADIAATFTGMFYLGYVPSFWVRIRLIGAYTEPTRLAPIAGPILASLGRKAETALPSFFPKAVHLPITTGAIFIFWTWISLAFSDVGAYFVGRQYGKTKLGTIAPAAGSTSPNKSVEGVIGGCTVSAAFSIAGAWIQKWPLWFVTGAIHGVIIGLLGLIGDLTASMLKRDAGLKDFGDLIPEHGGILDRVDSFVWTAPYSWLVCSYVIPALKAVR